MSTHDQVDEQSRTERPTELSVLAQRLVDQLESAAPEDRTRLVAHNRDRLTQLSLVIDGLRHAGLLPEHSHPDSPKRDS